jgi:hypothetical protein
MHDLCLSPDQVARIRQVTDDWVGGWVMVWEVLSQVPENQRLQFVDSGLPATMRGDRLTYFSEAVFSGLDDTLPLFLNRSTIFDPVDPNSIARYLPG